MLILELHKPHWLSMQGSEHDLCVHGGVEVRVDNVVFSDGIDTDWTVSASALYFLRTLTQDHTKEHPVCEHLIPHCGFAMFAPHRGNDVTILGCPNGIDFEVRHFENKVVLTKLDNERITITKSEWQQAIFQFTDAVEQFYNTNEPRQPEDKQSEEGYKAFWTEWKRRRYGKSTRRSFLPSVDYIISSLYKKYIANRH
jgi:hypothetical protein